MTYGYAPNSWQNAGERVIVEACRVSIFAEYVSGRMLDIVRSEPQQIPAPCSLISRAAPPSVGETVYRWACEQTAKTPAAPP
jgi:hypothetical protein